MKSSITIAVISGILGLMLGLTLAHSFPKLQATTIAESSSVKLNRGKHVDGVSAASKKGENDSIRTRVKDRGDEEKSKEPRVSIPLKTMVEILKEKNFKNSSEFDIHYHIPKAFVMLGATEREQETIKELIETSKSEILAAEKIHLKLGKVTSNTIQMDMSGMRGPAEEIVERTKDRIRKSLPIELAEGLVTMIHWENYYPVDEKSFVRLEVTRNLNGELTAWEREGGGGSGRGIDHNTKTMAPRSLQSRFLKIAGSRFSKT